MNNIIKDENTNVYRVNNHYKIGDTKFGLDNGAKKIEEKNQNICGVIIYNLKKRTKPTNDSIKNEGVIVCDSGASFSVVIHTWGMGSGNRNLHTRSTKK